ncbi:MAG TPA: glycosyl hydrolase family 18 protein [Acidimicrobiales bacterium]|nr:glycosyl hydrolase family 18 protein [Acidimicrobiales bacterium]
MPPARPRTALLGAIVLVALPGLATGGVRLPGATASDLAAPWDVMGYVEPGAGAGAAIDANRGAVTSVGMDESSVTANGSGITAPDRSWVRRIHAVGAKAEFLVSNWSNQSNGFSAALAADVLQTAGHRDSVAQAIASDVVEGGWDGVTIDFESIRRADRADLVTFVAGVRARLPRRAILVVDIPASSSASDPHLAPFDDRGLARHADELMLMAYDQHYPGGPAGPVAGLAWVKASLGVALRSVPPSELQLGEAGYGYRWYPDGRATSVGDAQARRIAARNGVHPTWSAARGEWHATLPDRSVLWWSDARAQALDTAVAAQAHLRGIGVWQLVQSDPLPPLG